MMMATQSIIGMAQDNSLGWPREIDKKGTKITFYQPQPEIYENNIMEGRMAVSLQNKGKNAVFGAVWFKTNVKTDFDDRTVEFVDVTFHDAVFPDISEDDYKLSKEKVTKEVNKWDLTMSLDQFIATLDGLDRRGVAEEEADAFNNEPPQIFFRQKPAVLVLIDGEPTLRQTSYSKVMKVINTPYFIVWETKKGKYYLNGGEWWWESTEVTSGWKQIKKPPKDIRKLVESERKGQPTGLDSAAMELEEAPEIIVATGRAELLLSDGDPEMKSVGGESQLLFMSNSENDVLLDVNTQQYYVLISGRWFRSGSLTNEQWTYIRPDRLPEEFQKIPEDSEIANVRVSIPQTQEAKEALLENSIPQTAEIDRNSATLVVRYDGDPRFEDIQGTDMKYAVNTEWPVLFIDGSYYAVDNAVWFVSTSATGPWVVSTAVPDKVQDIPPDCPVYNVKYVYIYDYTDEVVYVGYTPGYYGSYVVHSTVVYGTGFYYHPWYGRFYYPRPVTYGFGVHYNPWTGWGFTVGVSYGWVSFSAHRGYWGAAGWRAGYRHGYRAGAHRGFRHGYTAGRRAGYRAGATSAARRNSSNAYRNRSNGVRSTGTRAGQGGNRSGTATQPRANNRASNNVYTDRNGNAIRRGDGGNYQQRNNRSGQWQNYDRGQRSGNTPNRSGGYNANRDYQNRSRGTQRANNYNNRSYSRPSSGYRGGGARRGGGRRR